MRWSVRRLVLAGLLALGLVVSLPRVLQAANLPGGPPLPGDQPITDTCTLRTLDQLYPKVPCPTVVIGLPASVTIDVYAEDNHHVVLKTVHVRDQSKLQILTGLLNHLHWSPLGVGIFCPIPSGPYDVLHFTYSNGNRWTVRVQNYDCQFVYTHRIIAWANESTLKTFLANDLGAQIPAPAGR